MSDPVVSAGWLAAHLEDPAVVVADVRWYLGGARTGRDAYAEGHVPGACFVDLDAELAAPKGAGPGRHPLPTDAQLRRLLSRLGAGADTLVVAYDDAGGAIAARLWWLLEASGHRGGRVLDGGLPAWLAAGGALSTEVPRDRAAPELPLALDRRDVVDAGAVARLVASGALLLDARARERYRGDVEPVDPRAGHVPGAVSAPVASNLEGGRFLAPEALRDRYEALGVAPGRTVIASCGSGVTACHTLLALARAGLSGGLLYEGSFSDWSGDPSRAVNVGDTP